MRCTPVSTDDLPAPGYAEQPVGFASRLAIVLLAVDDWVHGAGGRDAQKGRCWKPGREESIAQGQKQDLAPFHTSPDQ
jgi:hypothetical protein